MNCNCKDWQDVGELFHEAIGMIEIRFCPWCGAWMMGEQQGTSFSELIDPNISRMEQPKVITIDDMIKEPPNEPEAA